MNGLHGIIFAYEKAPGLRELTEARMPGSVPFGGRYRVVDFMLSNMAGAGITDVGVVLHGNYQSLLDHIGSGKTWDMARKNGGLKRLPPFADARKFGVEEFRGKMEALSGVRSYLHEIRQKYVVLSDSDLIINLPLQKVLDAHIESGADITCVCTESGQFVENATYFTVNEAGRITETRCAPHKASGCLPQPGDLPSEPRPSYLPCGRVRRAGQIQLPQRCALRHGRQARPARFPVGRLCRAAAHGAGIL